MVKRFILLPLLLSVSVLSFSQLSSNWINNISFTYGHSRRIPYYRVSVELIKEKKSTRVNVDATPMFNDVRWRNTVVHESFTINSKKFDLLANEVLDLYKIDESKAGIVFFDGYGMSISFGHGRDKINYGFACPETDTYRRGLVDFMRICDHLMDVGGLRGLDVFKAKGGYLFNRRFFLNIHEKIERNWWLENNYFY
ncbi:MAG: hypothetical protein RIS29_315 [Bacteroidota bacterium]|jgi:hypothetical protein